MRYVLVILVALPLLSWGQGNLVPNWSFEGHSSCPSVGVPWTVDYWEIANGLSPDYFHVCSNHIGFLVPCNARGCQEPHSGDAYVGIWCFSKIHPQGREYVQIELPNPLIASIRYLVSFYCSLAERYGGYAVSTLGAALTEFPPSEVSSNGLLAAEPQVLNEPLYAITDTANWVLISDTVFSRYGGERYLTIGNFNSDGESDTTFFNPNAPVSAISYYYIDDVSVIALDSVPSGVEEAEENQGAYHIYPNPSNGIFTIAHTLRTNQMAQVEVYDLLGQRILAQQWSGSAPVEVDLTGVSSGLYTLRILVGNELKFSEKVSVIRP